jgi:glycosyltransferase involved in cell wall biosynthesis
MMDDDTHAVKSDDDSAMSQKRSTICMFTPTAEGGHSRYSLELLSAMTAAEANTPRARRRSFELVSSEDLADEFRAVPYAVHPILPKLRDRKSFPNKAAWVISRIMHYPRRERMFLKWLATQDHIGGVHFQEWTSWIAAGVFRRIHRMGKQAFYTVHNIVPHKYPRYVPKALMHFWIRRACRRADGLFVHTDALAEQLSRFLGKGHPPIHVVPHGVWTVSDAAQRPPLAERLAWKKLLFFGTIRRNKGLDLLVRAMEQLRGYSLTIAGEPLDGQYFNDEIMPLVQRLQAAGLKIDLRRGFLPEEQVPALLAEHSTIVLPYTSGFQAQSGVVYLALAHEVPVVASEAGGLRDLLNEFRIGETFRQHTPEALAAAIHALEAGATQSQLANEFRAAKKKYSWDEAAAATIAGYDAAGSRVSVKSDSTIDEQQTAPDDCTVGTTPAH